MTVLTAAEGGRESPLMTGYQPQFTYDGLGWSARHTYIGTDRAAPGETVRATLMFVTGDLDYHAERLHVGKEFTVQEGSHVIATGHVTRILDL